MLTIGKVIEKLSDSVSFQPRPVRNVVPERNFCSGPLYKKIVRRWSYTCFKYFSCKIDNMTGNQLLQLLVDIFNDENLHNRGHCILFSLNDEHYAAIVNYTKLFPRTPSPQKEEDRGIFSFVFDDDYLRHCVQKGYPKDVEVVKRRRSEVKENLAKFLQQGVAKIELPIRNVFFGAVTEVALSQSRLSDNISGITNTCQGIPVAACLKLAVDSDQIGDLQNVFGEHKPGVGNWKSQNERRLMVEENRRPTLEENDVHYKKQRMALKIEAVKRIIENSMNKAEMGFFEENEVQQKIQDIKKLYQIEEP